MSKDTLNIWSIDEVLERDGVQVACALGLKVDVVARAGEEVEIGERTFVIFHGRVAMNLQPSPNMSPQDFQQAEATFFERIRALQNAQSNLVI